MEKISTITSNTNDNTNDQTHDFMKVDSFSQLPFLRPSSSLHKDKSSSSSASAIRLFGIDFTSTTSPDNSDSGDDNPNNDQIKDDDDNNDDDNNNNNNIGETGESSKKFECHYCCRNFPTSQALGGHQNAHKRERQQAKRAHLHSAMMAIDPHHHSYRYNHLLSYPSNHQNNYQLNRSTNTSFNNHGNYSSSLINTSRLPSYHPTPTTNTSNLGNHGPHHHHHHHSPHTINGNPLMWQLSRDRSLYTSLPYLAGTTSTSKVFDVDSSSKINMDTSSSHQSQVRRNGSSDHVSLDLHL